MTIGVCRLDELADVQLGGQTFLNDFFYLDDAVAKRFGIESRFLEPVFRNEDTRKTKDRFVQAAADSHNLLFSCKDNLADLVGTGAAAYIRWGQKQKHKPVNGRPPVPWKDTPRLNKDGRPWYVTRFTAPPARIVLLKAVDEYFAPFILDTAIRVDQRFNQVNAKHGVDDDALVGVLCSMWFVMLCETYGATSLGQGALEIRTEVLRGLPVPDLRQLDCDAAMEFGAATRELLEQPRLTAGQASKSSSQHRLDALLLEAFGLDPSRLDELYADTLSMGAVRKTLAAGRGAIKRERFEADVSHVAHDVAAHLSALLQGRRFPYDFIEQSASVQRLQLGTAPLHIRAEYFMGERHIIVKATPSKHVVYEDEVPAATGEYIIRALQLGQRNFPVPEDDELAAEAVVELHVVLAQLAYKLNELIGTAGPSHQVALLQQVEEKLNVPLSLLLSDLPPVFEGEY